ncbi:conserved hypothetical protein [Beggiatoa sp. PS]|nr:conserved hypothetical protein [Beggiatoa sp. PS]
MENSLSNVAENEKPARVVMVIITDGQENSSREFEKNDIEKMIKEKQKTFDWQFVFLSADLNAIGDALNHGIHSSSAMSYDKNSPGTAAAWRSTSKRVADYRSKRSMSVSFTDEDRSLQSSERALEELRKQKLKELKKD